MRQLNYKNNTKESTRVIGNFVQVVVKAFNPHRSLIPLFCEFYIFSAGLGKVSLQGFKIDTADMAEGLWVYGVIEFI